MRGALAAAAALKRTLLLPPLPCFCDKTWGGHDNIFKSRCMYPGAQDGDYLPFVCPLDHLVSPTEWINAGVDFRTHGFMYGPHAHRVPAHIRQAETQTVSVRPKGSPTGTPLRNDPPHVHLVRLYKCSTNNEYNKCAFQISFEN
jgi:hypothetical protein